MNKNDFWLDDPEWEMLRRKAERRPIPKKLRQQAKPVPKLRLPPKAPRAEEKEVVVNLKLRLPQFKLPKKAFRHIKTRLQALELKRHPALMAGAAVIVAVGLFGLFSVLAKDPALVSDTPKNAQQQAEADFDPLVPLENLADASGKQSKPEFKYDQEKKVLGYVAEFNTANLTISQQQVPEDFKSNPAKLMSVADSIKASKHIETQKGTAYIATDDKTKAQMAVFATDDVLVFIRSNKQLDEDEWKLYINQLNPAE